ncbi:unnamed protein product [Vicia faba]|uniref:Uncharacterized protein n=1 Tax=Vicia faba TaxID=3906 RepID=A0AAV0ZPC0_VICFA|nr:unnamed protein product [Vicia faba]
MKLGDKFLNKNGRLVSVDVQPLVSYAQRYWSSELLSVDRDVLRNLNALYSFSVNKAFPEFRQAQPLLNIYEISKFLLKSKCFSHGHEFTGKRNMIDQRITDVWQDIRKELIYENIRQKGKLTYGLIGRVVVMILGTANVKDELFVQIMTKFEANKPWKDFIESLRLCSEHENVPGNKAVLEIHCMVKLQEALKDTCNVNWVAEVDYVAPGCFMYLVEWLLLLTSCLKGSIYATKSSFT